MEFQANIPYPEIKVERKNVEYAKMLSYAYAGIVSEDTAIHLYMYQSFIVFHCKICNIFYRIIIYSFEKF